jgi:predicted esterase
MRKLVLGIFILLSFNGNAQQITKSLKAANGETIGFLQFTPPDYGTQKHPLIIFLHGLGERGNGTTELSKVAGNPIPALLASGKATMKFTYAGITASYVVLSPQLSGSYGWWQNFYIDEMLKYAKQNLNIDTNKIYLTGLSLGGGGTWNYVLNSSLDKVKQFAAIAPVCGTCQSGTWKNIIDANLGVWAFHAADDGVVPVGCTDGAIQSINALNPTIKPVYTRYTTGQHYIWGRAYDTTTNPNLYQWFLQFKRGTSPIIVPPPILKAIIGNDIVTPIDSIVLDGSLSTGYGNSWDAIEWGTPIVPPGGYNFVMSGGRYGSLKKTITRLGKGTYQFTLIIRDITGKIARDTVNVNYTGSSGSTEPIIIPPVVKTVIKTTTELVNGKLVITVYYSDGTSELKQ